MDYNSMDGKGRRWEAATQVSQADDGRSGKTRRRPACYADKLAQDLEDLDTSEDPQTLWSSFKSRILGTAWEYFPRFSQKTRGVRLSEGS